MLVVTAGVGVEVAVVVEAVVEGLAVRFSGTLFACATALCPTTSALAVGFSWRPLRALATPVAPAADGAAVDVAAGGVGFRVAGPATVAAVAAAVVEAVAVVVVVAAVADAAAGLGDY